MLVASVALFGTGTPAKRRRLRATAEEEMRKKTVNDSKPSEPEQTAGADGDTEFEFDIGPAAEFLMPPTDLRKKAPQIRSKRGEDEPVAAAEAALARMAESFDGWMAEETQRLATLWAEADADAYETEAREALYRAAHDIKGQAATLGFPLAGRVAGSLCRLLDALGESDLPPRELVRQHVQSVRAMFVEHAREETSPTAVKLADRLDEVTRDYLGQIERAA